MGIIRTVTGDINPDDLGLCMPHEHLLGVPPAPYDKSDPDLVLDDWDASCLEAKDIKHVGVRSLVEMTPIDYNRDPVGLKRISEATGLQIICVTGYLKDKFSAPLVEKMSIDDIAQLMITEIQTGIGDTGIRAGVIKASSSLDKITENESKVLLAAAIAQQETDALISTHTEKGTMALEQIDIFLHAGVEPNRILIGHLDHKLDEDYHKQIADQGVYMGYDQISKEKYRPDADRIDFIATMIARGHESQLMLSMDLARRSDFEHYGGKPGHTYLVKKFLPRLQSAGISQDIIDQITHDNPRKALTIDT